MTPAQVAKIVGCHPGTIRQRIRDGLLDANMAPARKGRYHVHRGSLIRWLLDSGWAPDQIREAVPQSGPLFVVSSRRETLTAVHAEPKRVFGSMFEAALAMRVEQPWGLLADLVELGVASTCASIQSFREVVDRPVLIGLIPDSGMPAYSFDFGILDSLPAGKIAQRIRGLRPWITK